MESMYMLDNKSATYRIKQTSKHHMNGLDKVGASLIQVVEGSRP